MAPSDFAAFDLMRELVFIIAGSKQSHICLFLAFEVSLSNFSLWWSYVLIYASATASDLYLLSSA